uniref:Uncharacterized protein n=1 Tax=Tetraselmis sp. GSL018 TaxID=582737 RepID=A0A061QT19_9CHLO|mmetsp:Transcript_17052/g.40677  ORF Transcript_17052/g.40677 Transcript_17052/m.40677 type:complete len:234 (-) Transcript_17052:55-756(-)
MADRGRKAQPVANRLCSERWNSYVQKLHQKRLEETTGTPRRCQTRDDSFPETLKLHHLQHNAKKEQLRKERSFEIERENSILLSKLVRIQSRDLKSLYSPTGGRFVDQFPYRSTVQLKPGIRLDASQYPLLDCVERKLNQKSMNAGARQREQERIRLENQGLLGRLQAQPSIYSKQQLDRDWIQNQVYQSNIRSKEVQNLSIMLRRTAPTPPRAQHTGDIIRKERSESMLPDI